MTSAQRLEVRHSLTASGAAYELAPVTLPRGTVQWFTTMPQTLRELYAANATDKPFMVYNDETLTFHDAYERLSAIAALLAHHGVEPGDRVAISMRNYPEWMLSFAAATSIGAIAVGLNSMWQANELDYALTDSAPRVLLVDEERLTQWRTLGRNDITVIPVQIGRAHV